MGKWQARIAVPAGALALGVWLAVGAASAVLLAPQAIAKDKEEKPTLSPDVIKKLKPAQDALQKGDFDEGLKLAKEALAISTKPYDQQQSLTMIRYAYGKQKDFPNYAATQEQLNDNPLTTDDERNASWKTLAQIYAQQKDYAKAIKYATNWSEHGGGTDADTLLWQLYLVQKDCEHGIVPLERAVASHEPTEVELRQENSCYYQMKQDAKREAVMEQLVAKFPKRDYYYDLRLIYEDEKMDLRAMFNVLRLIYSKDYMTRESEFVKYAEEAIDIGAPSEALAAMNKGKELDAVKFIAATDHNSMLLAQAKQQAAEDKRTIAAQDKSAAAGQNGEADVKVGLAYLGLGEYQKAVDAITRGLSPERVGRVRRVDEANMNLGIAYLKLGKTDEAKAAFTAAKADPRMAKAANLWLESL